MKFELETPLIAAVRTEREFLARVEESGGTDFLLLRQSQSDLRCAERAHAAGKKLVFPHRLRRGIGQGPLRARVSEGKRRRRRNHDKTHLVLLAKELGLFTVQRFFLIDSRSVATALDTAGQSFPDLIELIPASLRPNWRPSAKRAETTSSPAD